MIVITYN